MNTFMKLMILFFAALSLNIAIANDDITGLWQGKLVISPDTEFMIQFNISQDSSGLYKAVLNTLDGGAIENVKADSVDFNAGNLKIRMTELSGSFEGIFQDGKIDGEWKQEGTSFPLSLKPYGNSTLSEEDMDMLLGTWQGKPVRPGGARGLTLETPTHLFRFEMSDQGEFTGTFSLPDRGAQEPISNMEISDGIFAFDIGKSQKFKGKLTDEKIVGKIYGMSITLVKGEYKAPVYNLELPKEIKEQLMGKWNGINKMQVKLDDLQAKTQEIKTISEAVEFRFETSENGNFLGFLDIGGSELPVADASISDGKLFLAVKKIGVEFTGEILADKLVGVWTQAGSLDAGGGSRQMTLNRGGYVAPE